MNRITIETHNITTAWIELLDNLFCFGSRHAPRGKPIREICGVSLHVTDLRNNVLLNEIRNPSYRFMIAEWLWIWFGHSDTATIGQYNKKVLEFSDDGLTFNGAYGTPVAAQWSRVVNTLKDDSDSRQAVIKIYEPPKGPTKDVPCTLSIQFLLRHGRLDAIVTMRSSDVWLGLPYDFFTFSQLANILAGQLEVETGGLLMNLGSSHLYEVNAEPASRILKSPDGRTWTSLTSPRLPGIPPLEMDAVLTKKIGIGLEKPWSLYEDVLIADSNQKAKTYLERY